MKTNQIVQWAVVTSAGSILHTASTRRIARYVKNLFNSIHNDRHRIAKLVVTK